ncbi:hypothetical protein IV203_033721 [Nitzschia inconspicua]|uniref:Uncharacterized protein n=1 Tax=Nitzschia inconspicua TaxID=303405 RepID=A0A9K3M376_9STRA|nr:hypothetical protein IV203_033721 [Nitzschia inconspicua]
MSSLSVWAQLYYKGKYEPKGQPVEIEPIPKNVASLRVLVKDKMAEALTHCTASELFVFSPESKPPFSEQISIRGDKMVKELIDECGNKNPPLSIGYDHPLILVAPDPPQQQPANEIAFLVGGTVDYTGNNLTFKAYFRSYEAACAFQNAMNQWEIHKELAHLGGVTLDPPTPAAVPWQSDFTRFYLQDYKPNDHESPRQTLDQLHSYHLSVPVTEPVEPASNLLCYQCIDQPMPHINHYKCHLKDKAKFKQLQCNENNMVAASWLFHQQLDGLNVAEGIPLVALSFKTASNDRLVSHNRRYRVTLLVEFFYQELAAAFAPTGLARKIDETSWEISLWQSLGEDQGANHDGSRGAKKGNQGAGGTANYLPPARLENNPLGIIQNSVSSHDESKVSLGLGKGAAKALSQQLPSIESRDTLHNDLGTDDFLDLDDADQFPAENQGVFVNQDDVLFQGANVENPAEGQESIQEAHAV